MEDERESEVVPPVATKPRISNRTGIGILVTGAVVAILYLGLTFAVPHVVPRLALLPAPPPLTERTHCEGGVNPETRTTVQWRRSGGFWTRGERFTLGGSCPTG